MKKICVLIILALWAWSVFGQTTEELPTSLSKEDISFYPNPANLHVTIISPAHVEIVNLVGKTVIDETTTRPKQKIDVSNLPEGIYFIKIDEGPLQRLKIYRS